MENYELKLPPLFKAKKPCKIEWTEDMLNTLIEEFPTSYNNALAKKVGVSMRTLIRKARELSLEKEPGFLQKRRTEISRMATQARRPNPTKGLKGWSVPGSEKTRYAKGHVPATKADPDVARRIRNKRNATIAREKRRMIFGLPPLTKLKLKI